MATRHRRAVLGRLVLGAVTVGLGMLAAGSTAHAQELTVDTTVPTLPVLSTPTTLLTPTTVTVPTLPGTDVEVPGLPGVTVPGSDVPPTAPADDGGSDGTSGRDATADGERSGGGGPAGSGSADTYSSGAGSDPRARPAGARATDPAADDEEAHDLGTLRRLAVQSAGDFSLPFLLGGLALSYLFFQRRMHRDDPVLAAAAADDDELLRFS